MYDCQWGTIKIRIVVAGELAREPHNAPLHLFSAQPALVEFGGRSYRLHSDRTSRIVTQLIERFQVEGLAMPFTVEDFDRQYFREHFSKLTPKERADVFNAATLEERLAGLTPDQIREYLNKVSAKPTAPARKSRRKK